MTGNHINFPSIQFVCKANQPKVVPHYNTVKASVVQCDTVNLCCFLQLAVKTLPFYTEYFGTPYPLNKMDLIAIPNFACGAMENWGLVTYRYIYIM